MKYNDISNLYQLFSYQKDKNPNKNLIYQKLNNRWRGYSYKEIHLKIVLLQSFFKQRKIKKGDRVFLLSNSCVDWVIIDLAVQSIGAVTVPAFTTNNKSDNDFIINDCEPKLFFIENYELFEKNKSIFKNRIRKLIFINNLNKYFNLDQIYNKTPLKFDLPQVGRQDLSCIIYTSGTYNKPKGVMLPHAAILHNCEAAFDSLKDLGFKNEVFLSFLPLSHSYERMAGVYFPISIGAKVFFVKKIENINLDFKDVRPSIVNGVPRFYENLYKKIFNSIKNSNKKLSKILHDIAVSENYRSSLLEWLFLNFFLLFIRFKIKKNFGGSLKLFISGGAALDPSISRFFLKLGIPILQGYGQTEAGPLISCNTLKNNNPLSVGYPVKHVNVKINKENEILVSGPNLMKGYWNNHSLTKKTLVNNWLHTGDLGKLDEFGRLIITGRKKELIVTSGGDNISPQKIENLFSTFSEIRNCIIFGDSKPYLIGIFFVESYVNKAVISLIVKKVNKKLNSIERIRKFIITNKELTVENGLMTSTFKVKKKQIFKIFSMEINKLYLNS